MEGKTKKLKLLAINIYMGGRLTEHRINKGLSQVEMAKILELSRVSIVNIEAGRQALSVERVLKSAMVLDVSVLDLIPSKEWYLANKDKKVVMKITYEVVS